MEPTSGTSCAKPAQVVRDFDEVHPHRADVQVQCGGEPRDLSRATLKSETRKKPHLPEKGLTRRQAHLPDSFIFRAVTAPCPGIRECPIPQISECEG